MNVEKIFLVSVSMHDILGSALFQFKNDDNKLSKQGNFLPPAKLILESSMC